MRISNPEIYWRIPPALTLLFWAVVHFYSPLMGFSSDVSIIGFMGEDLANGEIWPIIMYGTDKQITSTPYLHALVAVVTGDSLSPLSTLRVSGLFYSFLGFWLLHESLLRSFRLKNRSPKCIMAGSVAFCLVVGTNISYLVSLGDISLTEQTHFCVGLQVYLITRLYERLSKKKTVPLWLWALLGVVLCYSYLVRPNAFLYGGAGLGLLFLCFWKRMLKAGPLFSFFSGLMVAYLPMLWHKLFRQPSWPVGASVPPLTLSDSAEMVEQGTALVTEVLAYLFLFSGGMPLLSVVQAVWCLLSLLGVARLMRDGYRSRDRSVLVVEGTLLAGSLLVMALMLLVRGLCVDWASSRYCLALLPIVAWGVVVGVVRNRRTSMFVLGLALSLALLQLPFVRERVALEGLKAVKRQAAIRHLEESFPGRVFFAKFWDAYDLEFVSSGSLRMVPFPFETTRRFGLHASELQEEKPLWLVEEERIEEVLSKAEETAPGIRFRELERLDILDQPYRILESDPGSGARLLYRTNSQYFVPQPTLPSWANQGEPLSVRWLSLGNGVQRLEESHAIVSPADLSEGHTVAYGPYIALHPGMYRVDFYLEIGAGISKGRLICEVVRAGEFLAQKTIEVNRSGSEYVQLPFEIETSNPRDTLEFRVWKEGGFQLIVRDVELIFSAGDSHPRPNRPAL